MMNYNMKKEQQEAIWAGEQALLYLREAQNSLSSARTWGWVDIVGGGLLSDIMKYSKMDDAQQKINQAQYALQRFDKELRDVAMALDIQVSQNELIRFADFVFDGFVADFMAQSRIEASVAMVSEAIYKVEDALMRLRSISVL